MTLRLTVYVLLMLLGARVVHAQDVHVHSEGGKVRTWEGGIQAIGVVTHASPAMLGKSLTEGYVTQPAVMGMFMSRHFEMQGMLNLEGLTLKRGELNHGIWGEGYIDRRHPHTYLHEAVVTWGSGGQEVRGSGGQGVRGSGGVEGSVSLGRGFVPFGTDDPMVRPFVSYPSNHHLSQILERWVAIGAARYGPVGVEYGRFNGDEPTGPKSLGEIDNFGDSWSVRGTVWPMDGLELQGSRAFVRSPEFPAGGGLDQKKYNVSARLERKVGGVPLYALVEHARTADTHQSTEVWVFTSTLAEIAADVGGFRLAARYENSIRPEEERLPNPFRSVRPATDNSILGVSRFKTSTAGVSRQFAARQIKFAPFIEASRIHARSTDRFAIHQPDELFGNSHIWNISAGIRMSAGMKHERMGRYGAAVH